MGILSITSVRKVGPVQVNSVNIVGDVGGAQRWPSESFDELSDERRYRLILSAQLTFHFMDLLETYTGSVDLTGPDRSGSDTSALIWEHFLPSATQTDDPANLQGTQTMATVNRFQVNDIGGALVGLLLPPGFALTVTSGAGTADNTQLQLMVAESPDPFELKPFIGYRSGGIAGPQY